MAGRRRTIYLQGERRSLKLKCSQLPLGGSSYGPTEPSQDYRTGVAGSRCAFQRPGFFATGSLIERGLQAGTGAGVEQVLTQTTDIAGEWVVRNWQSVMERC